MGFFEQNLNNKNVIIFEAPKTGGTSLRIWIYYYLTGNLIKEIKPSKGNDYYTLTPKSMNYLLNNGYSNIGFLKKLLPKSFNGVCIIRDPVERFLSCFYDKIIGSNAYKQIGLDEPPSLEAFVEDFFDFIDIKKPISIDDHSKKSLKYHFSPLAYHYGTDPSIFNKIFWTKSINSDMKCYLEKLWGIELPTIHARMSKRVKEYENIDIQLKNKIKLLYEIDYDSGFFK